MLELFAIHFVRFASVFPHTYLERKLFLFPIFLPSHFVSSGASTFLFCLSIFLFPSLYSLFFPFLSLSFSFLSFLLLPLFPSPFSILLFSYPFSFISLIPPPPLCFTFVPIFLLCTKCENQITTQNSLPARKTTSIHM